MNTTTGRNYGISTLIGHTHSLYLAVNKLIIDKTQNIFSVDEHGIIEMITFFPDTVVANIIK